MSRKTKNQGSAEFHVGQPVKMSIHFARRVRFFEYQGELHPQWLKEPWLCRGNIEPDGAGTIIRSWPGLWVNPVLDPEYDISDLPRVHGRARCRFCAFEEGVYLRDDGSVSRNFTP